MSDKDDKQYVMLFWIFLAVVVFLLANRGLSIWEDQVKDEQRVALSKRAAAAGAARIAREGAWR